MNMPYLIELMQRLNENLYKTRFLALSGRLVAPLAKAHPWELEIALLASHPGPQHCTQGMAGALVADVSASHLLNGILG